MIYRLIFVLLFISFLSSCSSDDEVVDVEEDPPFTFAGNWLGNWSDSLFPILSVSARVQELGANRYSGSFYWDNMGLGPYVPCCGGAVDDGKISFETKGDSVINFKYIQDAPNYMGGCPGVYTGSGFLNKETNRLTISFQGDDCDGFHGNGRIIWRLDK